MKTLLNQLAVILVLLGTSLEAMAADILQAVGSPAAVSLSGYPQYNHIQWQKVDYSQGDCPVPLTAIVYWSPDHIKQRPIGTPYYTPVVEVHGGGWVSKATYEPPSDPQTKAHRDDAAGINKWVVEGVLLIRPTYRGTQQTVDIEQYPSCDHPRELIRDAEFLVRAVHERDSEIPQVDKLRSGDKIRITGGSAGAHVAMSLATRNPAWYDRLLGLNGVYDLQYVQNKWVDDEWEVFGDLNLAECDAQYDGKVTAATIGPYSQNPPFNKLKVSQQNCRRVPVLEQYGTYKVTDANNPQIWAVLGSGFFKDIAEQTSAGETVFTTWFLSLSYIYPSLIVASSANGQMPNFGNSLIIQEVTTDSVPVLSYTDAREESVDYIRNLYKGLVSGFMSQSFLDMDEEDPLLVENSFGKMVLNSVSGEYPAFRLITNTGDFTLPAQALSFCNDIQVVDGLLPDEIITKDVKGTIYQCGDKGVLSIATGGDHFFTGTNVRVIKEFDSNFAWFLSESQTDNSLKVESCGFIGAAPLTTTWVTAASDPGVLVDAAFWGSDLANPTWNSNSYSNEWNAMINDPLYVGSDTTSTPLFVGEGFVASAGDYVGSYYVDIYTLCLKPL